ncbi:radical SAM protein [Magnetospirillum sp. 15-1]|uniref:B12-binding domain-containing radical SAM protein n=1 Tax=Magnetospirillum sp. 15-1 TaxID=1979370 RepID=UPI000BBC8332|nr:radical SAM protein [Magnetospirillum sp. 15-1]
MKVLFSNPPWWQGQALYPLPDGTQCLVHRAGVRAGSRWPFTFFLNHGPDNYQFGSYLPYPYFMGHAATWADRELGGNVTFRDSIALRESYDKYYEFLQAERFEYIVIESASPSWEHDKEVIGEISRRLPHTRFIITGPITSHGERLLDEAPNIQAAVRGEYEKGVIKALNGANGVVDFDLLTVAEMNSAPFPYFDNVIAHRYCDTNPRGQQFPQAQVLSSRGCPYKCIFCVWPATMTSNDPDGGGKRIVRQYGADYMEAFLTELVQKYGFRSIYFDDDTFNLGDRHVEKMCAVMRKIGVPWSAMCRADTSSFHLWQEMKDSGCFGVKIGFESGNQEVVDNIVNKRLDLEEARKAAFEIKRVGMTLHGTFTFGLPGETPEQMQDTETYMASLPLDSCQKSGCAEIEGAPLHTLGRVSNLKSYPGAKLDENYSRETDGQMKIERMRALQV